MRRLLIMAPLIILLAAPVSAAPITAIFYGVDGYVESPYLFGFYIPDDRVGVNQSPWPGGGLYLYPNATLWWFDATIEVPIFDQGMQISLTDQEWGVEMWLGSMSDNNMANIVNLVDYSRAYLDPAPSFLDFRSPFFTNFGSEHFPEFDASRTRITVTEPSSMLLLVLGACLVLARRHTTRL